MIFSPYIWIAIHCISNILACSSSQINEGCCNGLFNSSTEAPQWQLSENGAGGTWKAGADFIQFDIADDTVCGGTANAIQTGTAIINFNTDNVETIVLSMEGVAESSYERFDFYIDNVLTVRVQASDSSSCQVSTCNMCDVSMAEREITLTAGSHTIRIEMTTIDHLYHLNCYFRINFSIKQPDVCKSCECPNLGSVI